MSTIGGGHGLAEQWLRKIEDAVIEGDLETAAEFSEKLLDFACEVAVEQRVGYLRVLAVADQLSDIKGFPFRD